MPPRYSLLAPMRHLLFLLLAIPAFAAPEPNPLTAPLAAGHPLYLDTTAPIDTRVADLVSRMTLEEKATALDHDGPDLVRFGLRSDKWNQILHGVWWTEPTTMFPVPIAMAATWDPALLHSVAVASSDEARAIYNGWHTDPNFKGEHKGLIYRSPVINISRNPYWGRINECYGEDPTLTGRLAVAFVKGIQGDDPRYLKLAATLKHFAVNNVEKDRKKLNAVVPERMLYEYWLPHWREAVVEGGAQSVMASYNAINGTPDNINHWLLTDTLKGQWHFPGFVVSDLGGVATMVNGHFDQKVSYVDAVAKSVMAGCDFSDKEFMTYIPEGVREGKITEARLDDAVTRVMRVRMRLGEFDPQSMVPYSQIPTSVIGDADHRALALKTARESIVLLENKDSLLPLDKSKIKTIAVIGPAADIFIAGGYSGKPNNPVKPLQGIQDRVLPGTQILHVVGGEILPPKTPAGATPPPPFDSAGEIAKAVAAAKQADVAILYLGTTIDIEGEGHDRTSLALPGDQEQLAEAVITANPRTIVVLMSAGPLTVPWLKQNAPAMLQAWWLGDEGGDAIADVLFGDTNPAGRLPYTVYASETQVPPQDQYDITQGFTYMYVKGNPLYPFGYGLSYTHFAYSNLQVSPKTLSTTGTATVTVDIENNGARPGDEVVQLYTHASKFPVVQPKEVLRDFQRISLDPGEKKTVTLTIPAANLAYYDVKTHAFVVNPGNYEVRVGASSSDIRTSSFLQVTP